MRKTESGPGADPNARSPERKDSATNLLGKKIENFRVVDFIGKGGMGEVYVGYDEKLQRKVALKAIRGEKRFHEKAKAQLIREAQILSQLEHPHICRIYDFLETEDADVLVLELIKGTPLNKMPLHDLGQSEKLRIAVQIGGVLADAHALGVVHRDLKPENVMINDRGDVKVLDFGLAFSLVDHQATTMLLADRPSGDLQTRIHEPIKLAGGGFKTEQGIIMGTPMYMSPEQACGKSITAASDMYSFGLLLQWMFTERSPYPDDLSQEQVFLRAMKGETRPSDGVQEDLKKLIERLKTADPTGRPRALDTVERLKWILGIPKRRTRKLAVGGAIGALSLGIVISSFSLLNAKRSERLERIARSRQEKISDFLVEMWVSPSPMERGRDVKVTDVLSYWEEKLDTEFQDDPDTKARLLNQLGTTYRRLGEYEKAESVMTKCLEFSRQALGPDHTRTITAMIDLGILLSYNERFQEAEALFREALVLGQNNLDQNNELVIGAKDQLADMLINKAEYSEAKALLQEAVSAIRADEKLQHKFGPKVLLNLGNILMYEEDFAGAESIFLELLKDYEKRGDTGNPNYIAAKGSVAWAYMQQRKYDEGLRYFREGMEKSIEVNGERHRTTLILTINFGIALFDLGKYEEALLYTERGYQAFKEIFGERAPDTVFISVSYANALRKVGRLDEAEALLHKAIALNKDTLGTEHPNTLQSQLALCVLYYESGRNVKAEELARTTLATSARILGDDKEMTLECKDMLGRILNKRGDHVQAEQLHREVLETKTGSAGGEKLFAGDTLMYLAESLFPQGKNAEACRYAEQAVRSCYENWGGDHPRTDESVGLLVKVFAGAERAEEGEAILKSLGLTAEGSAIVR
jgi:tetratricopeptide (TPR) repeat protein/tRNA A-37 threonylcarbamoyl transferase component Bud32